LEHISDIESAVSNLLISLKEDGYIYIHMPLKKDKPVFFGKFLNEFHAWTEEEHQADEFTKNSFLGLLRNNGARVVWEKSTFNHYFGELCVSLIMLFYKKNIINDIFKACLSPLMHILIRMDVALKNKEGNAVAVLLKKEKMIAT
jgi:hypothetical protein